jgi:hypothetical protein
MLCDVCRTIGLFQNGRGEPISYGQRRAHHYTYGSLQHSVRLDCFVCVRVWDSLLPDEQQFIQASLNPDPDRSKNVVSGQDADTSNREPVTTARLAEDIPEDYLWYSDDSFLQISFRPITDLPRNKQGFWRVQLALTKRRSSFPADRQTLVV